MIDENNKEEAKGIYREFMQWRDDLYGLHSPEFEEILYGDCIPADGNMNDFKFTMVKTTEGKAAGLLIINENWPVKGTMFIGMMYILKNLRGRGIGKSILSSLYDFRGSGFGRLMVRVHKTNKVKPVFFLKNGFRTVQILPGNDRILERNIN